MDIKEAANKEAWDSFLAKQEWSPFLQSWTMGEVYQAVGEDIARLEAQESGNVAGLCFAHVVPAKRGRHLAVPYGPILTSENREILTPLIEELKRIAKQRDCSFIRISPFWEKNSLLLSQLNGVPSPMHLLAEHLWVLDLKGKTEQEILMAMRKTTRNLIRRAEKEGVTIRTSENPDQDISHFFKLHEETRQRHHFTPYTDEFFQEQLLRFAKVNQATLYLAEYQGNIVASSIHMHFGGETSYHHGASTAQFNKIPASYLLQWTAIKDALLRKDHVYNFWGIAPENANRKHPFAGITTFKTGFGGERMELSPCMDIPLSNRYHFTRAVEIVRKWRRGF